MTVWAVLVGYDYEGEELVAVFSSEAEARLFESHLTAEGRGDDRIVRECRVEDGCSAFLERTRREFDGWVAGGRKGECPEYHPNNHS